MCIQPNSSFNSDYSTAFQNLKEEMKKVEDKNNSGKKIEASVYSKAFRKVFSEAHREQKVKLFFAYVQGDTEAIVAIKNKMQEILELKHSIPKHSHDKLDYQADYNPHTVGLRAQTKMKLQEDLQALKDLGKLTDEQHVRLKYLIDNLNPTNVEHNGSLETLKLVIEYFDNPNQYKLKAVVLKHAHNIQPDDDRSILAQVLTGLHTNIIGHGLYPQNFEGITQRPGWMEAFKLKDIVQFPMNGKNIDLNKLKEGLEKLKNTQQTTQASEPAKSAAVAVPKSETGAIKSDPKTIIQSNKKEIENLKKQIKEIKKTSSQQIDTVTGGNKQVMCVLLLKLLNQMEKSTAKPEIISESLKTLGLIINYISDFSAEDLKKLQAHCTEGKLLGENSPPVSENLDGLLGKLDTQINNTDKSASTVLNWSFFSAGNLRDILEQKNQWEKFTKKPNG